MLFVGLVGNVRDGAPSTESLCPAHFCSMVGFERAQVDLSQSRVAEYANAKAEDKIWYEPLWWNGVRGIVRSKNKVLLCL